MVHEKIETMEQMVEEYRLYCKDLASDGEEGEPGSFCMVMSEWRTIDDTDWRLTDMDLVRKFLRTFSWTEVQVEYMVEEITKFDSK